MPPQDGRPITRRSRNVDLREHVMEGLPAFGKHHPVRDFPDLAVSVGQIQAP